MPTSRCSRRAVVHGRALDERHHDAGRARSRGASGSMDVRGRILRRIEVDDAGDTVDVHAAGGDVGCDQRSHLAPRERAQGSVALRLAPAAVDRGRRDTELVELLGESIGTVPRPAEHDRRSHRLDRVRRGPGALGPVDPPEDVAGGSDVGALRTDLVDDRVALDVAGELRHRTVERGREQEHLARAAGQLEDAPHRGEEAHVGHAVGFVDDDLVDVAE